MNTFCINILVQNAAGVTVANLQNLKDFLTLKFPGKKVTWCVDDGFIFPGNKDDENALIKTFLDGGDELGMGDGFPAIDHSIAAYPAIVDSWLSLAQTRYGRVSEVVTAYHIPAAYLTVLRAKGFKACTNSAWSQTNTDRFQQDGSKIFPYYPSDTNGVVPAKTAAETIDIVCCNSLTNDPLGCRVLDGDSRWTMHPADPNMTDQRSQMWVADQAMLQTDYPCFLYIEVSWLYTTALGDHFKTFATHLATLNPNIISLKDYGIYFRSIYPNNFHANGMTFTGSGLTYGNSTSSSNLKQYWFEDQDCSVCIQENLTTHIRTVECCLYYDKNELESYGYFNYQGTLYKDWSYKLGKNYKFDQFGTYYWKEINPFVDRAKEYFGI